MSCDDFEKLIHQETKEVVRFQERADLDYFVSGELRRDNYVSFVADHLDGVALMSMAEMIDYMPDKQGFEQILTTLDVPGISIRNAICTGRITRQEPLAVKELEDLRKVTDRPVKITLPGPYLLTRSMWLPKLSRAGYGSKEELGQDVIRILKEEIADLQAEGVAVIQFDEPVLTEIVFTEGKPRTFMCAALSEKKDPTDELNFAKGLLKSVLDSVDRTRSVASVHVCRGNWSRNESILLSGPYTPLLDLFEYIGADLLSLEFSTPRAGELSSLLCSDRLTQQTTLGLGVINPRSDVIEPVDGIVRRAEEALRYISPQQLWLNPDCGFATFSNRPVNEFDVIEQKLEQMRQAREILRTRYER